MIKRVNALFLILILALSLTACSKTLEESVVGTWEGQIDNTSDLDFFFEGMHADESKLPRLMSTATIILNKDNTCVLIQSVDPNSVYAYLQSVRNVWIDLVNQRAKELGIDKATIEARFGMSVEEYIDVGLRSSESERAVERLLDSANYMINGTWKIEEDKIVVSYPDDEDETYEYKGGKLITEIGDDLILTLTKK